ncbi:metallophosphoesterase [Corticicoccus populi]|uniref:Metallophosphoesterase n=1 Tax=Corticicoccus populi TaxID=1812821 RepID=A0ABW5WX17_9STAP
MKYKAIALGIVIAAARFLYKEDKDLVVDSRTITHKNIPESFDGYKLVHVSDFHNAYFGRRSKHLLKLIEAQKGDVILMTGDIIDRRTPNLKRAVHFIGGMTRILPTYYITGNHEAHYKRWPKLKEAIVNSEMVRLDNQMIQLERNGSSINLAGINDPWFFGHEDDPFVFQRFKMQLVEMVKKAVEDDSFTILMSHRPELFSMYRTMPVDLVLSGHAHGGQIRLPFVKGLYAPHQGVLPKYTEGIHESSGTTLSISRGLGNSRFPFRVFNHPEIVVITLKKRN